jgi:hypothetical protein
MTQQEPLPYDMPFPPGRPTSVTVLAIIGIVIGGFFTLCTPFSLIFFFVNLGVPNPVLDAIKQDDAVFAWTLFSTVVQWGLGILLLTSSIGSLNLKEWARKGTLGWAVASLAISVVAMILNFLWVGPKMEAAVAAAGQGNKPGGWVGQVIGIAIGVLFGIVYPLVTLYVFTRPRAVAAFGEPRMPPAA